MIIEKFFGSRRDVKVDEQGSPVPDYAPSYGYHTEAGERVSVARSKSLATVYRAKNIISDDIAKLPLQMLKRTGRNIEQVTPDPVTRNIAYLLQVSPNIWGWTPFQFKKASMEWLLFYGNTYIWNPVVGPRQFLVLPSDKTVPVFDMDGNLWYRHTFTNNRTSYIPAVEILHLLINPDETGFMGRGVITYARETLARQIASHKTQSKLFSQGFMPAAYVKYADTIDKPEAREKVRQAYEETMSGSDNAYRLAVFDKRITEFAPIDIQLKDQQFLESIEATDKDVANFFGLPLHMLNMGKQAYDSDEQNYIEYRQGTLDAYLVPWEEAARIRWLPREEQSNTYFKFVRDALLRMDGKSRAETMQIRIQNGMMTPNEAREKEDLSAYVDGDRFYMASNIAKIGGESNESTTK